MLKQLVTKTPFVNNYSSWGTLGKIRMIVSLFILVSLLLVGLAFLQSETLNSVRAFVRGEGLWAKGQKDAVFYLDSYVQSADEGDYSAFLNSLTIPLGDSKARRGLQAEPPDTEQAWAGFLEGGNHPDDINGAIRFFLYFEEFPYVRDSIAIWTEADVKIIQLQELGEALHLAVQNNDVFTVNMLLPQMHRLNKDLSKLEEQFSSSLSDGARWSKKILMLIYVLILVSMLVAVLTVTRRIIRDVDKTEIALRASENRFRSLYMSRLIGIIDWHRDGRILDANTTFLNMLGYERADLENGGLSWRDLTPADFNEQDEHALVEIDATGACTPYEKEFLHKDGSRVPVYLGAVSYKSEPDTGICFVLNQTERKADETRLRLAATVFESSSEGIMVTDKDKRIITLNQAFSDLSGYQKNEMIGKTPKILQSGLMSESFYGELNTALNRHGYWQGDIVDRKKDGAVVPLRLSINVVRDKADNISHYVAIFSDISERKAVEEQLLRLAHTDYLTGLANRSMYTERLEQAIRRAKRRSEKIALLFFDLDNFKTMNDLYGHELGDKLLQEVATCMRNLVREEDTVARIGGDEFVIIMEHLTQNAAAAMLANKISEAVSSIVDIEGHAVKVGCSVGISLYPDDGKTPIELTRCADIAMYAAKASGRNCYYYFNPLLESNV